MVRPAIAGLRAHGVDVAGALATARIEPQALDDPDARIAHEAAVRLWRFAETTTGDPDFGLSIGATIPPGGLGVLEYAGRKSRDVRAGLERVARYMRLNHDVAQIELRPIERGLELHHRLPAGRHLPRAAVDFVFAAALKLLRSAADRDITPLEVRLDYPRPMCTAALEAFYRAPLRFDAGERVMHIAEADANAPMIGAEPALCAILDAHARDLLARMPRTESFIDRVRALVAEELRGGNPTADYIADRLRMSTRTLQRRLGQGGSSHKVILNELRREMAASYLRDPRLAISEVAFLLGFSEPSAFHRAFKRWLGQTPAEYRAQSV